MGREVFRCNPLRGLPVGLIRGFMYGCIILLIALALGMDEKLFIPLLGAAMVICGVIGIISGIGKSIEADENGIYLKGKEYLFAENDMYMQVYTHYYSVIPVTERYITLGSKHKIKCSFLGSHDAGRLAKIIETGMREKYRESYDDIAPDDADKSAVQSFIIPTAELTEKIYKRTGLMTKIMFWFLTVLYSWILISAIVQDELEENWVWVLIPMIMNVLILGGVNFIMCRKFKNSARKIPRKIVFIGSRCYIDGEPFGELDIEKVVMTPEQGYSKGDMRKLAFYERNGRISEYSFGFKTDRTGFPEYGQLIEAVKDHFGDKFAYDID